MNSCSYGIILTVSCNGFISVIVSGRVPYSWMFCRICCDARKLKYKIKSLVRDLQSFCNNKPYCSWGDVIDMVTRLQDRHPNKWGSILVFRISIPCDRIRFSFYSAARA